MKNHKTFRKYTPPSPLIEKSTSVEFFYPQLVVTPTPQKKYL